ncbi:MAG: asparagine synthase (glutamine-hydrolyzing) [Bacteroidales bacterium]|jgi:asparagine synthase (glutamine-hydrolysing)|nr:asparagine synthase (glutamine-hydrolyzing) [Bacteroidales bacterium]MDD4214540.1 asparagine synthase (glutamine-hydrolyzing) [Bacteroidales bacterium]
MCGITGLLKLKSAEVNVPSYLENMTYALRHRGPDDEGYVLFEGSQAGIFGGKDTSYDAWNSFYKYSPLKQIEEATGDYFLGLGHRRLSVIDLSAAGHQPMCNDAQNIWVICNGEIYNYIELREEMKEKGISFISRSDVEVLLKGYEHYGLRFLDKINGMWSFVIYDMRDNYLIGCRDRFGVKPFYYYKSDEIFAFASEQKALMKLPFQKGINPTAVFDYLACGKIENSDTGLYSGIKELMPSHYFVYDLNTWQFEIKKYYTLSYNKQLGTFKKPSADEAVVQTREKIIEAVNIRLRSDVPVGFCLSGGIDSSSIIGVSQQINVKNNPQQLMGNLVAFTAATDDKKIDESPWAEEVVKMNNLRWYVSNCTADKLFEDLENIIYFQDSPLMHSSTFAQNTVMKTAREQGIVILLDGQGGDELFGGYVPFFIAYYFELLKNFHIGSLMLELSNLKNSPLNFKIFMHHSAKVVLNKILLSKHRNAALKTIHKESKYIHHDLWAENISSLSLSHETSRLELNSLLYDYFVDGYLRNLLRWEDRCSMQYSIESRTPFSDDTGLIEYIFSLPSAYKIHCGRSKYLLRESMKDFLPEAVYRRSDKLGFTTPQTKWLVQSNQELKKIIQEHAMLDNEKFADSNAILQQWDDIFSKQSNSKQIDFVWRYANFLLWRKLNKI